MKFNEIFFKSFSIRKRRLLVNRNYILFHFILLKLLLMLLFAEWAHLRLIVHRLFVVYHFQILFFIYHSFPSSCYIFPKTFFATKIFFGNFQCWLMQNSEYEINHHIFFLFVSFDKNYIIWLLYYSVTIFFVPVRFDTKQPKPKNKCYFYLCYFIILAKRKNW